MTTTDPVGAETTDLAAIREAAMAAAFNPAYRVSRCGQQSAHGPHVVESGPDQPRNCPGGPAWSWSFVPVAADEDEQAELAAMANADKAADPTWEN